jgi:hypothetical protein
MISRPSAILALLASAWLLEPMLLRATPPADWSNSAWTRDSSAAAQPVYRTDPRKTSSQPGNARDRRSTQASIRSTTNMQAEEIDSPPLTPALAQGARENYAWTDDMAQSDRFPDSMNDPPPQFGDDYCGPRYQDGWSGRRCRGPIYARGEYLLWWVKGDSVPPLVTTSPSTVARPQAGVLGQPDTTVLFGDERLNDRGRSGGRVVLGWWLDPCARIEGDFFILGQANTGFDQTSSGTPILARPFFNLGTGQQDSNVIAFPGQLQGRVTATESSAFLGAGLHATHNLVCADFCEDRHCRVDFLYGYRYLRLKEALTVSGATTSIDPAGPAPLGTSFSSTDSFATSNNFNGADLGLMAESRCQRWCLTTIGRLGIGATSEHVTINGSSTVMLPGGAATTSPGGLLALPTNIGSYQHSGLAVVPELELKLGCDCTPNLRLTVGYDLIYWSRVVRPGGQIDTLVNTSQASGRPLVGTPGPLFAFHESDLWVQGLSVGGELRF